MQKRFLWLAVASVFVLGTAFAGAATARQCRDASGKFMKCPENKGVKAGMKKAEKCRDASGKFAKCGTAPKK